MSICVDDKKERHPLPAALRPYNKDLPTPLQRMRGVRCRHLIDGLHTGIKNARMQCNRTELAVLVVIQKA